MPKRPSSGEESSSRRARRLSDEIVRALRDEFPAASVRFSQLDTGGADGLLIIRAPEAELEAIEAVAGRLVAEAQAREGVWIEPRLERPRGERRDRHQDDTFFGDTHGGIRGRGPLGRRGQGLPRKTAP